MVVRGPEGRNSFVLHTGGAEEELLQPSAQKKLDFRAYVLELAKGLALFVAIAGFILLPILMLLKWGWAVLIIPK